MNGGMFERDDEVEALERVVLGATRGEGGVAVVEGPAGTGKTALLDALVANVGGARVLCARGVALEASHDYGVVRRLLHAPLAELDEDERRQVTAGPARGTAPLFATREPVEVVARPSTPEGSVPVAAADEFARADGLYRLVAKLARSGPLALVVDDLQWCDRPSRRFLAFLAERIAATPIALVLGTRPTPSSPDTPALTALRRAAHADTIRLGPLPDSAIARLVEDALGAVPTERFLAACGEATGGNAFLVTALLDDLAQHAVAPVDDAADHVHAAGPERVSAAVHERLAATGANTGALVRAVATLGGSSDLAAAAAVADLDWARATAATDRACAARVLRCSNRAAGLAHATVAFVHPLVQRAIAANQPIAERSDAHRRAAAVLARRGADHEAVAAHLVHTPPEGDPEVVDRLRAAVDRAMRRGAPQDAARYARRARLEPLPPHQDAAIAAELGGALVQLGDGPAAVAALESAWQRVDDPHEGARLARQIAAVLVHDPTRGADAVEVLTRAIDALPPDAAIGPLLEADIGTANFVSLSAREAARNRERRFDDGDCLQLRAVDAMATVLYRGPASAANELARAALSGGRLLEAESPTSTTFWLAAVTLLYGHDLHGARSVTEQARRAATRQGSRWGVALASCFRSRINLLTGDLVAAEADARRFLELAPDSLAVGPAFLVDALVEQGRLSEAEDALHAHGSGSLNASMYHFLVLSEGVMLMRRGEHRAGLDRLFDLAEGYRDWGTSTPGPIQWRTHAAEALLALGERDRAKRMIDDEVASCQAFGAPGCLGPALRVAGLVAGGTRGIELATEACEQLAASPCRLEHAKALVDLGMQLRLARRRSDARVHLERGLALARACGATALHDRAVEELAAAGDRTRRPTGTGNPGLTPSEQRVARLAMQRRSNRQIAQELYVTVRTVETHLSNVYRKLGIHSRSELVDALDHAGSP